MRDWAEIREYRHVVQVREPYCTVLYCTVLYCTVVQVREPYERLLSAYRFTFQNKNRNRNNLQVTSILQLVSSCIPSRIGSNH